MHIPDGVKWLTGYGVPVASFDHNVVRAAFALDTLELAAADDITAMACYRSPEYQENIKRRQPHSIADIVVIEGYDGPQP